MRAAQQSDNNLSFIYNISSLIFIDKSFQKIKEHTAIVKIATNIASLRQKLIAPLNIKTVNDKINCG